MGLDDKRFSGDIDEDFRCPICRDIVEDPIASQCEHVFCRKCIYQWLQSKTSCPVDRKSLNISQLCDPSRYFRNFYSKLVLKCVFESNGCEESCKIENLDSHQNKCKFNPIVISSCEKGCEALLNGNELISHNCVQYLKSVNTKYEKNLKKMNKKQLELVHSLTEFEKELSLKRNEIIVLKSTIKSQSEDLEKAKIRKSEQYEFVKYFESALLSQSKALFAYKEKLESDNTIQLKTTIKFPVTHVIFDFDGNLFNKIDVVLNIFQNIAESCGKKMSPEIEKLILNGQSQEMVFKEFIKFLGYSDIINLQEFMEQTMEFLKEYGMELIPGVDKLIKHLHKNNIPMAIASVGPKIWKEYISQKLDDVGKYFSHVCYVQSDSSKPHSDIYLVCMKRFKSQPKDFKNVLIIGDIGTSIEGAVTSGMQSLLFKDKRIGEIENGNNNNLVIISSFDDFNPEIFGLPAYPK